MFADTMNTWELGLEPTPLFNSAKGQEIDAFSAIILDNEVQQQQPETIPAAEDLLMPFEAPLDLDIFERELRKHEVGAPSNANLEDFVVIDNGEEDVKQPLANSTLIDDAFANNLAVIADPKMLTLEDDSGFETGLGDSMEMDDTQNLIDEMESFLRQHEDGASAKEEEEFVMVEAPVAETNSGLDLLEQVMEEVQMKEELDLAAPAALSAEESEQAEAILDALIKGDLTTDYESSINNAAIEIVEETATTITKREVVPVAVAPQKPKKQPIFNGINNISEVVTADGQKIVIVIANDMPTAGGNKAEVISSIKAQVQATIPAVAIASPAQQQSPRSEPEDTSDSDWSPYSPAVSTKTATKTKGVSVGRVAKQRGPYSKRAHASVRDKKERKKLQNVEAARRYRDKKKLEQNVIESEEDILERKNKSLKGKLSEMENELNTLKKLMTELGLVK